MRGSGLQEKEGSSLQKSLETDFPLASGSESQWVPKSEITDVPWVGHREGVKILAQSGSKQLFAQSSQSKNHRLTELFLVGASRRPFPKPFIMQMRK